MTKSSEKVLLVLNAGSSSLKYSVFNHNAKKELIKGHVDGIGLKTCFLKVVKDGDEIRERFFAKDHLDAVLKAFDSLKHYGVIKDFKQIGKVGHRVVHGGEKFYKPTKITPSVLSKIKSLSILAPLHNPPAIAGILAVKKIIPKISQYAVFDTAFHHTIPKEAFLYGIPIKLYEEHSIRKYGFHGISHGYVSAEARKLLGKKPKESDELITCHLGNGSSITAVKDGKSIDTSMGFTPLVGLLMGTRSGDIDPEIVLYLLQKGHYTPKDLDRMLNKESGLKGIAGVSDVRELHKRALQREPMAVLALDMLAYRIAKFIGSYAAAIKGLDAIVFTGGIGENAYYLRRKACSYLGFMGVEIDAHLNRKNSSVITKRGSKVKVLVIPTHEELAIAKSLC